ncbi:uncharacterized protein LOC133536600 isoform X2 [Nerophis ophidion]|uniref:uncharacterized protein LOC133536600 isoform X2 n=1 Tax=Nerophis ophidion TaxID=159077 RepID=UPI002ADFD96B|nr:uncharacterized protein LOC133536600 isoform X2 [Nerophis ophidion]
MSKELRCRLIRNTMTSMMAILRARGDEGSDRYPSKPEITAMAKRIVQYYPMLQDKGLKNTWVTVFTQLYKRLQNVRSPQKRKKDGSHSKSSTKRRHLEHPDDTDEIASNDSTVILDLSTEGSSSSDPSNKERGAKNPQLLLEEVTRLTSSPESNKPADSASPDAASQATLAKHYKALQALFKRKNPNYQDVSHLLDLKFAARRLFIDSDTIREEDRPEKILEAYPCFKDIGHCNRLSKFCVCCHHCSPPCLVCPAKVRDLSQALVHVLEEKEDPNSYLRKRPLTCPSNCLLAGKDLQSSLEEATPMEP